MESESSVELEQVLDTEALRKGGLPQRRTPHSHAIGPGICQSFNHREVLFSNLNRCNYGGIEHFIIEVVECGWISVACESHGGGCRTLHWRERGGHEIDFVVAHPQIAFLHFFVVHQVLGVILQDDSSSLQNIAPIGNAQRHIRILFHQ